MQRTIYNFLMLFEVKNKELDYQISQWIQSLVYEGSLWIEL